MTVDQYLQAGRMIILSGYPATQFIDIIIGLYSVIQ